MVEKQINTTHKLLLMAGATALAATGSALAHHTAVNADDVSKDSVSASNHVHWTANSVDQVKEQVKEQKAKDIKNYVAVWGDTVSTVAEAYGQDVSSVAKQFGLDNPDILIANIKMSDQAGVIGAVKTVAPQTPVQAATTPLPDTSVSGHSDMQVAQVPTTAPQTPVVNKEDAVLDAQTRIPTIDTTNVIPPVSQTSQSTNADHEATQSQSVSTSVANSLSASQSAVDAQKQAVSQNTATTPATSSATSMTSTSQSVSQTPASGTSSQATSQAPVSNSGSTSISQAPASQVQSQATSESTSQTPSSESASQAPVSQATSKTPDSQAPVSQAPESQSQTSQADSQSQSQAPVSQADSQSQAPASDASTSDAAVFDSTTSTTDTSVATPDSQSAVVTPVSNPVSTGVDSEKVIQWFYNHQGQLTYSMTGSRTGADGTADCSGAMTEAIEEAGGTKAAYLYNTDTLHAYLQQNGYQLISHNQEWNAERGDIVIWGAKGASSGGAGHVQIMTSPTRAISVNYATNGAQGTAVKEWNYDAAYDITRQANGGSLDWYVYRQS